MLHLLLNQLDLGRMKKTIILICLLLGTSILLIGQSKQELKRTFVNAEFSLLYEEYKEALPLFLELYDFGKDDAYIQYRIGQCYLNIRNQKDKAIPFLENAIQNISENFDVGYYNEKNAPIEAYYQLGIAYRVNNRIEDAIEAFTTYQKLLNKQSENKEERQKLLDMQLQSCYNALELRKTPTNILEVNLGPKINSPYPNTNPVVSENEDVLVYTSELRFYDGVFFTKKRAGTWLPARNISLDFQSDRPLKPVYISRDGTTLYLQRNDNDDYNLYTSRYVDGFWQAPEKMTSNINTAAAETHVCLSYDEQTLYFTSNREGGFGGFDIYKCEKNADGEWGQPQNIGPPVNTIFDEATPFITENNTLYFSSQGHFNIGGFDIFTTKVNGDNFSEPENLGLPFNTTDNDLFFFPIKNGKIAYYSKYKENSLGENDIYRITILGKENIPETEKTLQDSLQNQNQ